MKIVLLANNKVGWEAAAFLMRQDDTEISTLVVHPDKRARYKREIVQTFPHVKRIIEADQIDKEMDYFKSLDADLALSVYFGYILKPEFLALFPRGVINLHPSLLPYNRGAHPAVWSIIDGTPAGATLHYIDEGIDTGDVIVQKPVEVQPFDTGESLYRKLEYASIDLLKETWSLIVSGKAPRKKQKAGGPSHRRNDLAKIRMIDLDKEQSIGETIDLLRALSFPGGGAKITVDGYTMTIKLSIEWKQNV